MGITTDGAAANVAGNGLKGLVEKELEWIFWMWCLAHRLELAIKDALRSTMFDLVDEMLLHLYYIYEKSPKKCSELESIVTDLKGGAFGMNEDGAGITANQSIRYPLGLPQTQCNETSSLEVWCLHSSSCRSLGRFFSETCRSCKGT